MAYSKAVLLTILLCFLMACNQEEKPPKQQEHGKIEEPEAGKNSLAGKAVSAAPPEIPNPYASVRDTSFVVMSRYAKDFAYDMKYATEDNFLQQKLYVCDLCLLRKEVADALKEANNKLISRGLRIKFYDCYRPEDVQKQMWEMFPNPIYVANPYTTGSVHNRGGAVDITMVDLKGQELDMGTGFDYFGKKAHHAYTNLPDTVLSNRRLLKETMEAHGFKSITSEWWHYSFRSPGKYTVSNFRVECE